MRSRILLIAAFCCCVCFGQATDYYSLSQSNYRSFEPFLQEIDIDNPDLARLNAAIFHVTNQMRKKKKLPLVTYLENLETSSTIHSEEMVTRKFFDHVNRRNRSLREPSDRAKKAGITNPMIAENIIEGFLLRYKNNTPVITKGPGEFLHAKTRERITPHTYLSLADELVDRWMHSKGHRKNILSNKAVQLGCGTAFYLNHDFNEMPCIKATQNFQYYTEAEISK